MKPRYWLCTEYGETFMIEATSRDDAEEAARLYGGQVLRELKPEEVKTSPAGINYTEATE